MPTCFVIQPFDKGKFDKRYEDVYEPAIRGAGFEPYRVDRDHGVTVPIESIESGIRQAEVCLADITTDNPNVWYELGFAFAARRPVVMVCSDERPGGKFPFDIQHRTILTYKPESSSDFIELCHSLTEKIKAISVREEELGNLANSDLVSAVAGLSQPEVMLLAVLASDLLSPSSKVAAWKARRDCEQAGMTGMGFNLALRRLAAKDFMLVSEELDPNDGEPYATLGLSDRAWEWIDANDSQFVLHSAVEKGTPERY